MNAETTMSALRRDCYAALTLYAPDRAPAPVDLSDNTNRWGIPPAAGRALRGMAADSVTRYPEAYAHSLKKALAEYSGVDPSMIVTGCGSDDVLDSAIRAFAEPGGRVAIPDPSFAMIPAFARMNGLVPAMVPLTADYDLDVDAMLAGDPRLVYVCSPNNPTGTPASRSRLEALARAGNGVVIVDEAYAEFANENVLGLVREFPNLLVVRTLSKAFGLAGLRVGYAIGAPALVEEVEKSRGPYKVSALASAAAEAALREDLGWVRQHVALAIDHRARLLHELRSRGIDAPPSSANFVFAPLRNAQAISRAMRSRGVAVRLFTGLRAVSPALAASGGEALRVSVGPWDEINAALNALDAASVSCA